MLGRFRRLPLCLRLRTPLFHPDFPLILFWSEKSGSTLLVKWFFAQVGLLEEARRYGRWIHRYELEVYKKDKKTYRRALHAALRSGQYRAVKLVRDPAIRAASAFLILAERGAVGRKPHWVKAHWDDVDAWLAKTGRDPAAGISFLDHLAMVAEVERAGPHTINPHLSPQYVEGERAFVTETVPLEGFADWMGGLSGMAGVRPVDLAELAASNHHHGADLGRNAELGERPETVPITRGIFADGRYPSTALLANARARPAIEAAYGADFAAYGHLYGGGSDDLRIPP